jgi:uncharacterized peroxidase-related enzyme
LIRDEQFVNQLKTDYHQASLEAQDLAMLDFVDKLTRTPWEMLEDDISALREVDFSDRAILDINLIAGYYAFVNRLADGLGVELEPFWNEQNKSKYE